MLTAKELTKLAKACRKAGIKSYKGPDFEIVLEENYTPTTRKTAAAKRQPVVDDQQSEINSEELSQEALLFWSVADPEGESKTPVES